MSAVDLKPVRAPGGEQHDRHLPGEAAVWVFILGDMLMFSAFFGQFYWDRAKQLELFNTSQTTLSITFGAINTLLLLTGSLFVVLGVLYAKRRQGRPAARQFTAAFACASAFAFNKILEYGSKLSTGITPVSNDFYTYYYVFTGIHMLHLLIGMAFLWNMRQAVLAQNSPNADRIRFIEVGASYWHLVDLLWIVLFPILYIVN